MTAFLFWAGLIAALSMLALAGPALLGRADARRGKAALMAIAAVGPGIAFYAFSGNPTLPSRPATVAAAPTDATARSHAARMRDVLLEDPGNIGAWVELSTALGASGETDEAVEAMQVATRAMPDSADLWAGLGEALVNHAQGFVSPAARLAFDRASVLQPGHPAATYYLGMAWLQAAQPDEALRVWQALAASAPDGAPWLATVERMIAAAQKMMAMGMGEPGFMDEARPK